MVFYWGYSMAKERVLITGASSGIGAAMACQFADAGFDLILVARSADKLQALAEELEQRHSIAAAVESQDLSVPGAARQLQQRLLQQQLDVDVLVNNAGVLEHGNFVDKDIDDFKKIIDLNISGLTEVLHAFLPGMLERGHGRVLNVGSIAAFQPVPSMAVYAASKAYVLSLTEALSEEYRGRGVSFTALCPGITDTPMKTAFDQAESGVKLPEFMVSDPAKVAREGFEACIKGEVICVPDLVNKVTTLGFSKSPRRLMRRVVGFLGRRSL